MHVHSCPQLSGNARVAAQSISVERLSTQFVRHVPQAPCRVHWPCDNRALTFTAHFRCHRRAYPAITRLAENNQLHFDFDEIRCPAIYAPDSDRSNENAAWKKIYFACALEKSWLDTERTIDVSLVVLDSLQSFKRQCVEFEPCEINIRVGARWRIGTMSISSMIVIIDACFDDSEISNDERSSETYPTTADAGENQDQPNSTQLATPSEFGPFSSHITSALPIQRDPFPKTIALAPNFDASKHTNLDLNSQSWCPPCNFSFEHISQFAMHLEIKHKIPRDSDPKLLSQIHAQCNNLANLEEFYRHCRQSQDRSSSDADSAIDVQSLCGTSPGPGCSSRLPQASISRAALRSQKAASWSSSQCDITWGSQHVRFTCHICGMTYRSGGSLAESLKAHITLEHQHTEESERFLDKKSEKYTYESETISEIDLENLFLPADHDEKCPEWELEIQDSTMTGNKTEDIPFPSILLEPSSIELDIEWLFPNVGASSAVLIEALREFFQKSGRTRSCNEGQVLADGNCSNFDMEWQIESRPDTSLECPIKHENIATDTTTRVLPKYEEPKDTSIMIRAEEAAKRLKEQIKMLQDELAKVQSSTIKKEEDEDSPMRCNGASKIRSAYESDVSGHRSSHAETWMELLPWINMHFEEIMGDENPGAIEYLRVGPKKIPTICITAEDSSIVDREFLERKLNELDIGYEIRLESGGVGRSARNDRRVLVDQDLDDHEWPSNNARFQKTPSCGASIGTMDDSNNTASFGGLIQVKFGSEWRLFGLTSHHLLEDRTQETPIGHGVMNGTLDGKEFRICQPSRFHNEQTKDFLNRYIQTYKHVNADDDHEFPEEEKNNRGREIEKLEAKLDEQLNLDEKQLYFGKVMFSSGYGRLVDMYPEMAVGNMATSSVVATRNFGHTMDWQLIGDIPAERSTNANYVSGGNFSNLYYEDHEPITRTVSAEFFKTTKQLFKNYPRNAKADVSPPEPHCRIHGVGAMTGSQDGYLSPVPASVKLEKYGPPSMEWSFAPRYSNGLGKYGDSGAWIFNDFGSVVGMILGVNPATQQTYFTPIQSIFNDIKESLGHLGVEDVRVAEPYMDVNEFSYSRRSSLQQTYDPMCLQFSKPRPRESATSDEYLRSEFLNRMNSMIPPPLPIGSYQAQPATRITPSQYHLSSNEQWNFLESGFQTRTGGGLQGWQKSQQPNFGRDPQRTPSAFTDQNSFRSDSAVDFPSTPVLSRRKLADSSAGWTPASSSGTCTDIGQAPARKRQRISDPPHPAWNGSGSGLSTATPGIVHIKTEPETPR